MAAEKLASEVGATDLMRNLESTTSLAPKVKGLYLFGPAGCGKTTISKGLKASLTKLGKRCLFVNVPDLLLEIRDTFKSKDLTEGSIIDFYTDTDYLFLDDLGAEKQSEYTLQTLYVLINRCESKRKPILIVTANLELKALAAILSDRIASRIMGLCSIIHIGDIDHRGTAQVFKRNDKNKVAMDECDKILAYEESERLKRIEFAKSNPQWRAYATI